MDLRLDRIKAVEEATIGRLYIDGEWECFTLEDRIRPVKIKGISAIPEGRYQVIISYSPRFKRLLPLLLNVKNYSGIRIHAGNRPEDTEGRILAGAVWPGKDWVGESRAAFDQLFPKLRAASEHERITIEIVNSLKA